MSRRVLCYAPGWYVTVDGRKIKGPYKNIIRCELEAQQIEQHKPGSNIDVEYVERRKL